MREEIGLQYYFLHQIGTWLLAIVQNLVYLIKIVISKSN